MFDSSNGLPLHALVVHAVVILAPLSAVALGAAPVSGRARAWLGWGLPALASTSTVLSFVATQSGESLQRRVEDSALVQKHAQLRDTLPWFLVVVTVLAWVLWWIDRVALGSGERATKLGPGVLRVMVVMSVAAALALTVQVVRVGDAGARATWDELPAASSMGT